MSLRLRLRENGHAKAPGANPLLTPPSGERAPDRYQTLKQSIHRELIAKLDLALLEELGEGERRAHVERLARRLVSEAEIRLTRGDEERLIAELLHDTFDLGPITPLLLDEEISDILVNTHRQVYVERLGRLELTSVCFRDESHLRHVIDRIISQVGRRIDESTPLVDARLPDGSRVNAIIPPAALDGPILSIRRFRRRALSIDDLLGLGALTSEIAMFVTAAVRARLNLLVTGGTGSGKTTLLNILSRYISDGERIVTIEDSAELMLQQPHVVRLETRPPNVEGRGEITQRDLLRNALRMRPDRIVVGEVRGDEVLDMLQAMNTGHDGSITTLHSNGPRDALYRLENLVLMAGHALPDRAIREQIASALQLIVHVGRLSDGSRRLHSGKEVVGMEGSVITMQELFRFTVTGVGPEGRIRGRFEATGIVPRCFDRFAMAGVPVPHDLFDRGRWSTEVS
ncbi:MAG: CpaF family protein [Candidatus Eisenbacteria bacterium]|uniref:CpaF family protein n=1 Tax=Eiseniibacteriota bacterium TaxID=2212470 RepID=A0A538UE05_UNCEI|nr:MAG: CpaF family protein [Candidatus Eisenbacteria bacterium]